MMISKRFSPEVTMMLSLSREEALRLYNDKVTPAHLMLGIIRQGRGPAMEMLASMNADIERLRSEMERVAREQSGDKPFTADDMPLDNTANRIMRLSVLESMLTHSEMIDVIHILLALLREESNEASQALAEQNINYRRLAQALNLQPDTNASYGYTEDEEDDEEEGEEMVTTAPSDQPCEDAYTMELAAPGIKKEYCRVNIDDNGNLAIAIENKCEHKHEDKKHHYLRREFSYSNYEQAYTLPDDVERDKISAKVEDGILTVTMPKMVKEEKTLSKAIEVS